MDAKTPPQAFRSFPPRGRRSLTGALAWLGGFLATGAAVAIGAVLAVVFAAAFAVIAVMGSMLAYLTVLAMRARRRVYAARRPVAPGEVILEARKVGHSWVAYGWEGRSR